MAPNTNPFAYEAANKLSTSQINRYYIDQFNYSRFVNSKRNIFLLGERGSGKSMILMYYSIPVAMDRVSGNAEEIIDNGILPVYITCNTPLAYKKEYDLLSGILPALLSEHYFVVSMMHAMMEDLKAISSLFSLEEMTRLRSDFEYIFDKQLPDSEDVFSSIQMALQKANVEVQSIINRGDEEKGLSWLFGFNSGMLQLIAIAAKMKALNGIHFSLMIDDAHLLNEHQIRILNSWISFRDNSSFSFKVAKTKVDKTTSITSTGSSILEGHDYTEVDLEAAYQNKSSEFGRYARLILKRRLETIDLEDIDLDEYFPVHPQFIKDMEKANLKARMEAEEKYKDQDSSKEQIDGYIHKMARAHYFRDRGTTANIPPAYTGLETIIQMSTGVVRNLLHPCYYMYDNQYSVLRELGKENIPVVRFIEPKIQFESIKKRSEKAWLDLKESLPLTVEGCSTEDALRTYQMMDQLAILFHKRLLTHKSEPRAISFTISETTNDSYATVMRWVNIVRKAQLMYAYLSSAKDKGQREMYFVPNRILCLQRQLDPIGQHARVSLKAKVLYEAGMLNKVIPYDAEMEGDSGLNFFSE